MVVLIKFAFLAEVKRIDLEAIEACDKIITEAETKKVVMKEEIVESIISKFR